MRKTALAVVAALLVLSIITGCSRGTTTPTTAPTAAHTKAPDTSTEQPTEPPKTVNRFGWEVPEETIEFTFYMAEQGDPVKAAENTVHYDEFLLQEFNVKLHKIVYDVNPTERLNLMLVAGDYPDAISSVSADQVALFVAQGKAIDMAGLVEEHGPMIKSQLGDLYVRYFDDNGALYALPKCWGLLPIPDYSASIRYDYWLEAGSPEFETPYEFYDVLVQLQQAHPENEQGQRTYALSDMLGSKSTSMIRMLTGAWGLKSLYDEADDHTLTHWMNTDEGLEIVKFANKVVRDGQMDPDFLTNEFEQFKEKVSTDRIMGYIGSWWPCWTAGHMTWQLTDPDWKFEKTFINVMFKDEKADKAYLSPKDLTGSSRSFITDKAEKPEDIIKWWNFEISDIGTKVICLGIPDSEYSDWNYIDGKSIWHDDVIAGWEDNGNFDLTPYDLGQVGGQYWMVSGQQQLSGGDPRTEPWCNVWFDQNFNAINPLKKILHENLAGTWFDNSYRAVQFTPDNPLTMVNTQLNDMQITGWGTMLTCATEAECETAFYALRDQMNQAGLHDLEAFLTEEYKAKLEKWGGN